jgi:hypothetical protein
VLSFGLLFRSSALRSPNLSPHNGTLPPPPADSRGESCVRSAALLWI